MKLLNENKNIEKITSKDISEYIKSIEEKLKGNLTEEIKKKFIEAKDSLFSLNSPLNNFKHEESELIQGLKKGKWIVFDGIEMANIQISEKLSSLCGEAPTLNVFESGLDNLRFDSNNINPNFRLFIIYNPSSQNAKKIDQALFNKCIKFTLYQIDSIERDATTMLYENIINVMKNPNKKEIAFWSNLSARITRYHIDVTKKVKEKNDLVALNAPFTSRNLCFISKDYRYFYDYSFKAKEKNKASRASWLKSNLDNYYWRSFNKYKESKKNLEKTTLEIINLVPNKKYKADIEMDFTEEFKEIIKHLVEIQNYVLNNSDNGNKENNQYNSKINIADNEFNFKSLLNHCLQVPLNEGKLESLYNNFDDTILLLDNALKSDDTIKNVYYQIHFIKNNYENILKNLENEGGFQGKIQLNEVSLIKNNYYYYYY